jgi:DNA-binding NtrC family response regulator
LAQRKPPRVLLLENDGPLQTALGEGLAFLGYAVFTAKTATEALESLRNQPFDVIIADTVASEDWSSLLNSTSSVATDLPIILVKGPADREDPEPRAGRGNRLSLSNPVTLSALRNALESVLGRRSRARTDGWP